MRPGDGATVPHSHRCHLRGDPVRGENMIQKLSQRFAAKNVRKIPRHRLAYYSFIACASAAAVILTVVL
ncbi:MAG TPA: hypothetical protein VNL34_03285 [Candidatus Nitrosotenuis sp.]|nr:hypothetical protein [Candidatus Nitrosotenuis sp.]